MSSVYPNIDSEMAKRNMHRQHSRLQSSRNTTYLMTPGSKHSLHPVPDQRPVRQCPHLPG